MAVDNPTFLLLETVHPQARALLESAGLVVLAEDAADALRIVEELPVHAIITRGKGLVREELLSRCPELRVVARVGVGLDNIDVGAAQERGVTVINAPGSTTTAAAEHTFLLIAALARGLVPVAEAVKAGDWERRATYKGDDLSGKTLGIVGMGAIGQRVARLAEAFGMSVGFWNRSKKDVAYEQLSLGDLLAKADVVSVCVALTPDTIGLIGRDELALMKPGVLLVNTARGAIIDQAALVEALTDGRVGGFAADVLTKEPPDDDDPLLRFENVVLTPHVAALTETTYRKMCIRTVSNVIAVLGHGAVDAGDVVRDERERERERDER